MSYHLYLHYLVSLGFPVIPGAYGGQHTPLDLGVVAQPCHCYGVLSLHIHTYFGTWGITLPSLLRPPTGGIFVGNLYDGGYSNA